MTRYVIISGKWYDLLYSGSCEIRPFMSVPSSAGVDRLYCIKNGNQQDMCDSLDMDTRGEKTGRKAKDNLEK